MSKRSIVMLINSSRTEAQGAAQEITKVLSQAGIEVLSSKDATQSGVEVVLVLGGDGTILRGAEIALDLNVPLLGDRKSVV